MKEPTTQQHWLWLQPGLTLYDPLQTVLPPPPPPPLLVPVVQLAPFDPGDPLAGQEEGKLEAHKVPSQDEQDETETEPTSLAVQLFPEQHVHRQQVAPAHVLAMVGMATKSNRTRADIIIIILRIPVREYKTSEKR